MPVRTSTLHLRPRDAGPFCCAPARIVELEDSRILCNDIRLPHDGSSPRPMDLWVIGYEFGPIAAVWADCVQDALDEAVDAELLTALLVDEEEVEKSTRLEREHWSTAGNCSQYLDLTNAWYQTVEFVPERDWKLIARFAEARGQGAGTLDEV